MVEDMHKFYPKLNLRKLKSLNKDFEFQTVEKYHDNLLKICEEIEKTSSPVVSNSLKQYIIIKLVSLVEDSFKKIIKDETDRNKIDLRNFFDKQEISIPIHNLDLIKEADFTKGVIVATNFNFHNPIQDYEK